MGTTAEQTATSTPWQIDVAHSQIEFAVKHMMVSTTKGRFTTFSGDLRIEK